MKSVSTLWLDFRPDVCAPHVHIKVDLSFCWALHKHWRPRVNILLYVFTQAWKQTLNRTRLLFPVADHVCLSAVFAKYFILILSKVPSSINVWSHSGCVQIQGFHPSKAELLIWLHHSDAPKAVQIQMILQLRQQIRSPFSSLWWGSANSSQTLSQDALRANKKKISTKIGSLKQLCF